MMKTIGILVSMLLAFNVEALDFSTCDALSNSNNGPPNNFGPYDNDEIRQCRAKVCGYDNSREDCLYLDYMNYASMAAQAAIALMVFIILLIIVHIFKEVLEQLSKRFINFNINFRLLVCS